MYFGPMDYFSHVIYVSNVCVCVRAYVRKIKFTVDFTGMGWEDVFVYLFLCFLVYIVH